MGDVFVWGMCFLGRGGAREVLVCLVVGRVSCGGHIPVWVVLSTGSGYLSARSKFMGGDSGSLAR